MSTSAQLRKEARVRRHIRVRKEISGTAERPRLSVFRSAKHIYAQLIDDTQGLTLVAASSQSLELRETLTSGGNVVAATEVGRLLTQKAQEQGITQAVFDRGGYLYHGRLRALADAARAAGLAMGPASDREEILEKWAKRKAKKQPQQEAAKPKQQQQGKKAKKTEAKTA